MHHAIYLPPFGELSEPDVLVEVAAAAEEHGWDGLFLWDHMWRPPHDPAEVADPWIALAAVAATTKRLRLGPMITPLARRRPQKVARESVTLDQLSHGRLTLGVGLGVNSGGELERFGECTDEKERADRLDEAIELLCELWSGEEVDHRGRHFVASGVRFRPRPVQQPRIPLWGAAVGSSRPRPLRRAAKLDGVFPVGASPSDLSAVVEFVRSERGNLDGYDVAAIASRGAGTSEIGELEGLGVTWAMWEVAVGTPSKDVLALARWSPTGT